MSEDGTMGSDTGSAIAGSLTEMVNDAYDMGDLPIMDDDSYEDDGSSETPGPRSAYARPSRRSDEHSDEEGDGEGEPEVTERGRGKARERVERPEVDESYSRLRLNHSRATRQLTEAQAQVRALEAEVKRLADSGRSQRQTHDDVVDLVRDFVSSRLGRDVSASDPRVIEALRQAATDLTVEAFPDASESDPELRQRRDQRLRDRQEREWRSKQEQALQELRNERLMDQQQRVQAQVLDQVSSFVEDTAEEFPFMAAASEAGEIDAPRFLIDAMLRGVAEGTFADPNTVEEMHDLLHHLSKRANDYYRGVAEKLSTRLGSGKMRTGREERVTQPSRRGPAENRASAAVRDERRVVNKPGRPAPTRGGGGRGAPSQAVEEYDNSGYRDEADDSLAAFIKRSTRSPRK